MNALAIPGSAALSASSQPFSNEGPYRPMLHAPIGSGFGAASTAAEVIAGRDLAGKTVVVTGGYSGIGVETVRASVPPAQRFLCQGAIWRKRRRTWPRCQTFALKSWTSYGQNTRAVGTRNFS